MANESTSGTTEPRKNGTAGTDPATGSTIQDTVQKLGAKAAETGDRVYREAVDAGKQAMEAGKAVAGHIEEQPWIAVVATGILGLALGFLLGRGSAPPPKTTRDYVDDYLPRNLRRR